MLFLKYSNFRDWQTDKTDKPTNQGDNDRPIRYTQGPKLMMPNPWHLCNQLYLCWTYLLESFPKNLMMCKNVLIEK